MFYLVEEKEGIHIRDTCKQQDDVNEMIATYLKKKTYSAEMVRVAEWGAVEKLGLHWRHVGDKIELRRYELSEGYIYNSVAFVVVCALSVCR